MFPTPVPSPDQCPASNHQSRESQEEFDLLFDSMAEEKVSSPKEEGPPPLTDNDLAVFDPCYKQGENTCEWIRIKQSHCSKYSLMFQSSVVLSGQILRLFLLISF